MRKVLIAAIAVALLTGSPARAASEPPGEHWVIDTLTGLAVPESVYFEAVQASGRALAAHPGDTIGYGNAHKAVILEYFIARAGKPITVDDQTKAAWACHRFLGPAATVETTRSCLLGSGYWTQAEG
jgi:hypothetical protein